MILPRPQLCCGGLFAILLASAAGASERCSAYLEPGDAQPGGYAARVRETLAGDATAAASMVVMPSFRREYAVAIARDTSGGERWVARYTIVRTAIWGDESANVPQVDAVQMPLDAALALRIVDTWRRVIGSPIVPDPAAVTGDGDTYVFSADGHRANTWSPRCGLPSLAAQSGQALRDAVSAQTPAERRATLVRLSALLDAITRILPAHRS